MTDLAAVNFEHRFRLFAVGIGAMAAVFVGIRTEFNVAQPFVFLWNSSRHSQIAFFHLWGLKEVAECAEGALTLGEEEDAGGLGVTHPSS